jgi:hypothetical protein
LVLEKPLENLDGHKLKVVWRQGDMVGCCRISITDGANPQAPAIDHDAVLAMVENNASPDPASLSASQPLMLAWIANREEAKDVHTEIENQ